MVLDDSTGKDRVSGDEHSDEITKDNSQQESDRIGDLLEQFQLAGVLERSCNDESQCNESRIRGGGGTDGSPEHHPNTAGKEDAPTIPKTELRKSIRIQNQQRKRPLGYYSDETSTTSSSSEQNYTPPPRKKARRAANKSAEPEEMEVQKEMEVFEQFEPKEYLGGDYVRNIFNEILTAYQTVNLVIPEVCLRPGELNKGNNADAEDKMSTTKSTVGNNSVDAVIPEVGILPSSQLNKRNDVEEEANVSTVRSEGADEHSDEITQDNSQQKFIRSDLIEQDQFARTMDASLLP